MSVLEHKDISTDYEWNPIDQRIITALLPFEGTPYAVQYFAKVCKNLTDYSYWFVLGTLWVSYSGRADLYLWKKLFRSDRPKRKTSIMKPSELSVYREIPERIRVYRAHRAGERDWISYTLDKTVAERFAREREVSEIVEYELRKKDVIALFLRREEQEIIMLNPGKAKRIAAHPVKGKAL